MICFCNVLAHLHGTFLSLLDQLSLELVDQKLYPFRTGNMTIEHLLQAHPLHHPIRRQFWLVGTPTTRKLFGKLQEDLQRTAALRQRAGDSICVIDKEIKELDFNKVNDEMRGK